MKRNNQHKLENLKEEFIRYLKETKGVQNNSLVVYKDRLDFLKQLDFSENYLITLKSKLLETYKLSYVANVFTTIKSFYKFLLKKKYVNGEFPDIILKKEEKLKPFLTEEQIDKLLELCKNTKYELFIRLMLYAGLRISEAFNIKKENVIINKDEAIIKIIGKRNKQREIPLYDKKSIQLLKGYTFIPDFTLKSINYFLKQCAKKINCYITPHVLRHTYATMLYKKGVPIDIIQKLLGHSSISITQIYAKTTTEQLKNILKDIKFN
jgi:integrase